MSSLLSLFFFFFFLSMFSAVRFYHALDTVTTTLSLQEGETLISPKGIFELGFFHSSDNSRRYVGIWYKKITVRTVVWVANRFKPLTGSPGVLKVTPQGSLVLQEMNGTGEVFWTTNSSVPNGGTPLAQLLDTWNLVVSDGVDSNIIWQSFDYATDTLLADMKLGRNVTSLTSPR